MHGSRAIEDLYEFYRRPEFANHGGPAMVQFLDSVADILSTKLVYFGTSHMSLTLSRMATYPECAQEPLVAVRIDGLYIDFVYAESWQDAPFFRRREDSIRCTIEHARGALLELLARLKTVKA